MAQPIFGPFTRPLSVTFEESAPPGTNDTGFGPFFNGINIGQTVGTVSKANKTAGPLEVICMFAYYDWTQAGGPCAVSSFTESSSTLTFTKRFAYSVAVSSPGPHPAGGMGCELWTAPAPAQFNPGAASITYTLTSTNTVSDNFQSVIFAVKGFPNLSNYFDANFPSENDQESPGSALPQKIPKSGTLLTGRAGDLVYAYTIATGSNTPISEPPNTPAGWNNLFQTFAGGVRFLKITVDYLGVPKKGTLVSYQNASVLTEDAYMTVLDAFSVAKK